MAKVISEYTIEAPVVGDEPKLVEIKHLRTAQDANGADVEILDYVETKSVDEAIAHCEAHKAQLEASLALCEAELADMIAIRDAE